MEKSNQNKFITNEELINCYLSVAMEQYFYRKLINEDKNRIKIKICELLKYLSLCHYSAGEIPVNNEIDEIWHLWILQTKQYHDLTKKLPTGKFLHHSSNDYQEEFLEDISEYEKFNRHASFLASYVENFGDFTKETINYWPIALRLITALKINIEELNHFLKHLKAIS